MVKILNFIVLVRDRPFLFFAVAFPFLWIMLGLWFGLNIIIHIFLLEPNSVSKTVGMRVRDVTLIPITPILITIFAAFVEAYIYGVFKVLRLNKIIGFRKRRLAHWLAAWAERRLANKVKPVKEDKNGTF